ncbi:MAG: hypothetical protein JW827_01745 [Spirochaetes bacterium]|nr:hypothetical protein [Spirochaetota bacterium]
MSKSNYKSIKQRTRARRKRVVGYLAKSFKDAEKWDLEFWQKQTPQMRLSALVSIINDIKKIDPDKLKE